MEKSKLKCKVFTVIDSHEKDIVQTLKELVAIPSVCSNEGEAQKYVKALYSKLGLDVTEVQADYAKVSKHPAFTDSGLPFAGRPNIIGTLPGSPKAKSVILNAHIDVVSPEPFEAWDSNPWKPRIENGRMYGRGTLDDKSGIVIMYYALKSLLEAGVKPEGTVMIESVVEEEAGGGAGTLATLMEGYTADGLVISEPRPEVIIAMTGVYYFRVKVIGKTAHAGLAHLGINAIGKMNKIYDALVALNEKRARERHHPIFEKNQSRSVHLNIGTYKAGDWASTVAGAAEMECRISMIPGETFEQVKKEVETTVADAAKKDDWMREHSPEVTWFGWKAEPWEQDASHPLVTTLKKCAEDVFGREIPLAGRTAGMDTRFAQYFNMPSLTFGPAGAGNHGINEYVELNSLMKCVKVMAAFVMEWCGVKDA